MKSNLFLNYYTDRNEQRTKELDFCIIENIKNKNIDNIVVVCSELDWNKLTFLISLNEEYAINRPSLKIKTLNYLKKVIPVITNIRPVFNDYFRLISKLFSSDENINIISNLDIIIPPETIEKSISYLTKNKCLALSRWDAKSLNYASDSVHYNHEDSQDCWFFVGGVNFINEADFGLGVGGCDNKIAHLLSENGYETLNPSLTFKTYHIHLVDVRNYTKLVNGSDMYRIPPPYKLITPTV